MIFLLNKMFMWSFLWSNVVETTEKTPSRSRQWVTADTSNFQEIHCMTLKGFR